MPESWAVLPAFPAQPSSYSRMTAPAVVQSATLERFIDAWEAWDVEGVLDVLVEDNLQASLPLSHGLMTQKKGVVGRAMRCFGNLISNHKVCPNLDYFRHGFLSNTRFQVTVRNRLHDAGSGQAALYVVAKGDTPHGPWQIAHSLFLTFNAQGEKIIQLEEVVDMAALGRLLPQIKEDG